MGRSEGQEARVDDRDRVFDEEEVGEEVEEESYDGPWTFRFYI